MLALNNAWTRYVAMIIVNDKEQQQRQKIVSGDATRLLAIRTDEQRYAWAPASQSRGAGGETSADLPAWARKQMYKLS